MYEIKVQPTGTASRDNLDVDGYTVNVNGRDARISVSSQEAHYRAGMIVQSLVADGEVVDGPFGIIDPAFLTR